MILNEATRYCYYYYDLIFVNIKRGKIQNNYFRKFQVKLSNFFNASLVLAHK